MTGSEWEEGLPVDAVLGLESILSFGKGIDNATSCQRTARETMQEVMRR